jgi:hypothetical protein
LNTTIVESEFDARASGTDPPSSSEKERGCLRRAFERFAGRVAPLCALLGQMIGPIKPSVGECWRGLRQLDNLEGILLLLGTKFTPTLTFDTFFFAFGAFITALCMFHLVTFGIVGNLFPVKKLFLTATFDGILPKETRQKAIHARGHFDNLYLVVDQQNRWKSELLPLPASALLDPLLIGEKRGRFRSCYFLIDQFDLTKAEDYLIAEFLINPEE